MGVVRISLHTIYEQPAPVKTPLNYWYDACTASWTRLKRKRKFHPAIANSFFRLFPSSLSFAFSFSFFNTPLFFIFFTPHCIATYIHELMFVSTTKKKVNMKCVLTEVCLVSAAFQSSGTCQDVQTLVPYFCLSLYFFFLSLVVSNPSPTALSLPSLSVSLPLSRVKASYRQKISPS